MSKIDKKAITFSLKLSVSEAEIIKSPAAEKSKSVSAFLRDSVFESADFKKFAKEKRRKANSNSNDFHMKESMKSENNFLESDDFQSDKSEKSKDIFSESDSFQSDKLTEPKNNFLESDGFQPPKSADSGNKKSGKSALSYRKNLYFTPKEYEIICANAAQCGCDINVFIKECAVRGGVIRFDFKSVREHAAVLSGLSEVVNILAESIISQESVYDYQLETIVFRMNELLESEDKFLSDMHKLNKCINGKLRGIFSKSLKNERMISV